jgi:hypothetical protein
MFIHFKEQSVSTLKTKFRKKLFVKFFAGKQTGHQAMHSGNTNAPQTNFVPFFGF